MLINNQVFSSKKEKYTYFYIASLDELSPTRNGYTGGISVMTRNCTLQSCAHSQDSYLEISKETLMLNQ